MCGLWEGLSQESGALMDKIHVLIRELPENFLTFSTM